MQRLKKRGEVEAFDLGELTGVEVLDGSTIELKHCGHGLVSQWQKQLQRMKLAEVRRVSAMLAEYGEDALRELYQDAHDALEEARKAKAKALEDQGADVPEHLADPTPFRAAISTPEGFDDLVEAQKSAVRDCAAAGERVSALSRPYEEKWPRGVSSTTRRDRRLLVHV